jgi:hydroxyacylglutathione hydrolase
MIHEILPVGVLQCNCSIFGDEATRQAIVVDPGDEIEQIQAILGRHGLTVSAIVITHAHIDHIGGAAKLKAATGAPVYMNADDQELYNHLDTQAQWVGMRTPDKTEIDVATKDSQTLSLGSTGFTILHTPGHTQGSLCLWIPSENKVVAGDTLFFDSVGRTDLPGGDHRKLIHSIREQLWPLPDDAVVITGHGRPTTIGREKQYNPFLRGV